MKSILKAKHLTCLMAVMFLAMAGLWLGFLSFPAALLIVGLYQLSQFAMSKRSRFCYNAGLTPEQLKEFNDIMKQFGGYAEMLKALKDVGECEGGYSAIKSLPALLGQERKRVDQIQDEIKKLRKISRLFHDGHTGVRWVGNVPFVTDDCARALASTVWLDATRLGQKAMRAFQPNIGLHADLTARANEYLGMEQRAGSDLTSTDIPLPTIYVPQVIELVFAYGQARQYATVFPMGAGTVKLPQLQAGEDTFGFLGVGTAGMAQNITKKEVSAALVTFTANKAGGLIAIPTELEEDTFIPLGQFLARYIARQFAKLEDNTLFNGDGTGAYADITGIGLYCTNNVTYLQQLGAGKTKASDASLSDFRALRAKVNAAVLFNMAANGQTSAAYYMHPTMESVLVTFNTLNQPLIYIPPTNGQPAKLDGFPIRWIGVSQPNTGLAAANSYVAFFGDLSYWYLGERGAPRVEISREVYFATDELAMRALERIDVEAMAVDAMATLKTAAQ